MNKKLVSVFFVIGIFLVGCSKKEEVSLNSTEIKVSETGEFQVKGTSKKDSSFYVNDQIITSKEQDKDGNFVVNVKMDTPEQKANFKIKYLSEELLDRDLTFDTKDFEKQLEASAKQATEESIQKETQSSIDKDNKLKEREKKAEERKADSDITKLTDKPTTDQEIVLDSLAKNQFEKTYPYKGSKIHSLKGVIQNWTAIDDKWYFKAEATIVNEYGAKKESNVEIHITPTGQDSGTAEILDY